MYDIRNTAPDDGGTEYHRRSFLKWTAGGFAAVLIGGRLLRLGVSSAHAAELSADETGVFNYLNVLEQVQHAFYATAQASPYQPINEDEREILSDLAEHAQAHRDALGTMAADEAIGDIEIDLSAIDFAQRIPVLTAARDLEDLAVSAYNGSAQLVASDSALELIGRIASVEARHAATIRNLIRPRSIAFAGRDIIDDRGLDTIIAPNEGLAEIRSFLGSDLPQLRPDR